MCMCKSLAARVLALLFQKRETPDIVNTFGQGVHEFLEIRWCREVFDQFAVDSQSPQTWI
jgi:hypothetical protein